MTRVDIRPRCEHGLPLDAHCARCSPPEPPKAPTHSMRDVDVRLARVAVVADPAPGHRPTVSRCKGRWTITCSCGARVARTTDAHDAEAAWGRHRVGRD